jgi:two-component system, OmpR family, response regulator ArlR
VFSFAPGSAGAPARSIILVVEDFRPLLQGMKSVLEAAHYHVLPANTPESALHLSRAYPKVIRLLIARLVMPGMSGPELLSKVRAHSPDAAVLYTSDDSPQWAKGPLKSEVSEFLLPNPFTDEIFLERVRAALNSSG